LSQRTLPENTQHSQQTDIHTLGGIRTHDLSMRAAADLCLRKRNHRDRQCKALGHSIEAKILKIIWTILEKVQFHCSCAITFFKICRWILKYSQARLRVDCSWVTEVSPKLTASVFRIIKRKYLSEGGTSKLLRKIGD